MLEPIPHGLVPLSPISAEPWSRSQARVLPLRSRPGLPAAARRALATVASPRSLAGFAVCSALACAVFVFGLPAAAPWILAAGGVHYAATVVLHAVSPSHAERFHGRFGLPLELVVQPDEVESDELRFSYLTILRAHEELRLTLHEHGAGSGALRGLYASCSDAVQLAGRTALLGGPVRRYLDRHSDLVMAAEIARLESQAAATCDREAAGAYRRASAARKRELEIRGDVQAIYERMQARLEVVAASLASAGAASVRLCTMDVDQSTTTREALIEQLDALDDDLRFLEVALEDPFAASR